MRLFHYSPCFETLSYIEAIMSKLVYRDLDNKEYWNNRWNTEIDAIGQFSENIYPIKYANMVCEPNQKILEIGVGGGRVFNYCKFIKKYDIYGIENSKSAVDGLLAKHGYKDLLFHEDCTATSFEKDTFDVIMAFGVYHNFECINNISKALEEVRRIAKPGARFCISLRPNNLSSNLNEWLWRRTSKKSSKDLLHFHKMLIEKDEAIDLFKKNKFQVTKVFHDQNYPILRKFKIFRKETSTPRLTGYKLNFLGNLLNNILRFFSPYHLSNISVFIGKVEK